jgi:hypothetical protein
MEFTSLRQERADEWPSHNPVVGLSDELFAGLAMRTGTVRSLSLIGAPHSPVVVSLALINSVSAFGN